MSRRKKSTKSQKQRREQRLREQERAHEEQQDQIFEQETAERLFCSTTTATDAAHMCELRLEDAEADLRIVHLYHEVWSEQQSGPARDLAAPLAEILTELDRHHAAMLALARRLDVIAAGDAFHDHLPQAPDALERVRRALAGPDAEAKADHAPTDDEIDFADLPTP